MPEDPCRVVWKISFLGVEAAQYWSDFLVWERLLNANPRLRAIVELGSGKGGFSLYLLLQCAQRGMEFYTFDWHRPEALDTALGRMLGLEDRFYPCDLWQEGAGLVANLLDRLEHPLLLFCDNGNRPREFSTFLPRLRPGDLVAVHDWGNEFTEADIGPQEQVLCEPIFVQESEAVGTLTRFFKRL